MKVLQVNCVYGKGSTGKITYDLHKGMLEAGIESVVCYGRGKHIKESNVYKTCPEWYSKVNNAISRITGVMYGGCFFSTQKLISIIKKEKPNVVCLQCINGYFVNIYKLVTFLKENRIPTVIVLHAEFMYTANCAHAYSCEGWLNGCGNCPRYHKETNSIFTTVQLVILFLRNVLQNLNYRIHLNVQCITCREFTVPITILMILTM